MGHYFWPIQWDYLIIFRIPAFIMPKWWMLESVWELRIFSCNDLGLKLVNSMGNLVFNITVSITLQILIYAFLLWLFYLRFHVSGKYILFQKIKTYFLLYIGPTHFFTLFSKETKFQLNIFFTFLSYPDSDG